VSPSTAPGARFHVSRHTLLAAAMLLLVILAWMTLSSGLDQIPRSRTFGQRVETIAQLACGVLSLASAVTCLRWRRWGAQIRAAWAASLTTAAGLSSLVWGPPSLLVGLVFAAAALLLALGVIRLVRAGLPA